MLHGVHRRIVCSVARAAGGGRGVVPTSGGVERRLEGRGARAGCRRRAGLRRAPWDRGGVPQASRATPTEPRTEADGPQHRLGGPAGAVLLWPTAYRDR